MKQGEEGFPESVRLDRFKDHVKKASEIPIVEREKGFSGDSTGRNQDSGVDTRDFGVEMIETRFAFFF